MGEKKNIIIVAVLCFVLIIAGAAAYLFLFSSGARINKLLKTAQQHLSEEKFDDAITCYEKALIIKSDNEKAREGIINTYSVWADSMISEGNLNGALRLLENAVEKNEHAKDDQRLLSKIEELKNSIAALKPKEVVVEEPEEPEEPEAFYDFDISINESDFDLTLFGKSVTEWDIESLTEFVENDSSLTLVGTKGGERSYLNEDNTLEVVLPDDGESVTVNDKDNVLVFLKTDYEGYTNRCLLYEYINHKPSLGNELPIPDIMGKTIVEYLNGYSDELNDYILKKSIILDLDTEIRNAVLSTSEWVRDNTSAEIRGLKINFGTHMVDLHHSGHVAIDYIYYYY